MGMKIYVVNLKRRPDRKQAMLNQFEKYGITNFEFFEAVDGQTLDLNTTKYNDRKSARFFRPLTKSEIGCALSHVMLYKKILTSGERAVILEDDVILSPDFTDAIKHDFPETMDLVMFGYNSSNYENEHSKPKTYKYEILDRQNIYGFYARTYLKNEKILIGKFDFHKVDPRSYRVDFLCGTYAYSPSLKMCELFSIFNKAPIVTADFVWNMIHGHGVDFDIWATSPALIKPIVTESDIQIERQFMGSVANSPSFQIRANLPEAGT